MVLLATFFRFIYYREGLKTTLQEDLTHEEFKSKMLKLSVILISIYLILSFTASYFCWKHNTKIGWGTASKILFSLFVIFMPFEYLIMYLTHKSDLLTYMERTNTEFIEPIVPVASVSP